MNTIKFPGLNLNLQISKIAFNIGNIEIYWYAILMVFAFLIGMLILKIKKNKFEIKYEDILSLIIILIPVSIISARIYYVIFKLDFFMQKPVQIFNLRSGGLAIYGGIIGGVICTYIYCKKKKIDFLNLLDNIAPCLAIRTSNWQVGEFYKYRSIWNKNISAMENGNNEAWKLCRSPPNFSI